MGYVKCVACPCSAQCDEEGQCVNTWVTAQDRRGTCVRSTLPPGHYTATIAAVDAQGRAVLAVNTPNGVVNLPTTIASPKPAKAPPSAPRPPGGGSVTEQIFAACDAVLAEMYPEPTPLDTAPGVKEQRLAAARKVAIPRLEAAGVNINSARKGSSMWIACRR
jgi:hypothetical protein